MPMHVVDVMKKEVLVPCDLRQKINTHIMVGDGLHLSWESSDFCSVIFGTMIFPNFMSLGNSGVRETRGTIYKKADPLMISHISDVFAVFFLLFYMVTGVNLIANNSITVKVRASLLGVHRSRSHGHCVPRQFRAQLSPSWHFSYFLNEEPHVLILHWAFHIMSSVLVQVYYV